MIGPFKTRNTRIFMESGKLFESGPLVLLLLKITTVQTNLVAGSNSFIEDKRGTRVHASCHRMRE